MPDVREVCAALCMYVWKKKKKVIIRKISRIIRDFVFVILCSVIKENEKFKWLGS